MYRSAVTVCIVSMSLCAALAGDTTSGAITGDGVALRAGPGTNHPVMKRLNTGDPVTILGEERGWVKVAARAWVSKQYIQDGRVTASGLNVRSQPVVRPETEVRTLGRGDAVEVVGERGGWLEIATHAYVSREFVEQVIRLPEVVVTAQRPERPEIELPVLEIPPPVIEIEPLPIEIEVPAPVIEIAPPVLEDFPVAGDPVPAAEDESDPDFAPGNPVAIHEDFDLDAGAPVPASDADLEQLEAAEMTPELEEQILSDLLTLELDDAWALHGEGNPNFEGRAQFDAAVQELRELAADDALPSHEIDGTYRLEPGFWIGRKPEVVIEIKQAQSGGNDFVVLHKVFDRKKRDGQVVDVLRYEDQAMASWDPEKRRLQVEFPTAVGASGRLTGSSSTDRIRARYTIHTTGEIRGTYKREDRRAGRYENEWTCSSKGWREGSIVPVAGYYELKPSWYAFGYKPTVKTWIEEQADGSFRVTREVHEKDGRVIRAEGVGRLEDEREVVASFGSQHPTIRYEVENDGRIHARYDVGYGDYSALRSVDRRGESRAERGFRDGIEIEKFPTGLRRAWASTKNLFVSGGRAVGRFGKMVGTGIWDGTKWVGTKTWGVVSEGGRRIAGAGRAVGGGFAEGGRILVRGNERAAEEAPTAPVERVPIGEDGNPVIDIELGGDPVPAPEQSEQQDLPE